MIVPRVRHLNKHGDIITSEIYLPGDRVLIHIPLKAQVQLRRYRIIVYSYGKITRIPDLRAFISTNVPLDMKRNISSRKGLTDCDMHPQNWTKTNKRGAYHNELHPIGWHTLLFSACYTLSFDRAGCQTGNKVAREQQIQRDYGKCGQRE